MTEKEEYSNIEVGYVAIRFIEILCVAVVIFGSLWEGTEILNLSFPEFMMLYGGVGAVLSEIIARVLMKRIKKKENEEIKRG